MSMESFKLAGDLEQAFNSIGTSMLTDDFAAKLLAYVYVMGGGNEAVVLHEGLNAGIAMAQQKFNIKGGEVPKREGVILIQKYIKELEATMDKTPWLQEIFKRYDIHNRTNSIAGKKAKNK